MEFAKAHLAKFGWEEGKGLGKDETGITKAIKPKLKFDNSGIGFDGAEDFTYFWWQHAFDAASKNINMSKNEHGVSLNAAQEFDFSTTKISSKRRKSLVLNNFLKSATTLTNDGLVRTVTEEGEETAEVSENHVGATRCPLTDEELFRACGGRTAHKGARHGLKLSGKLARVEEQEKKLLAMMSTGTKHTTDQEEPKREEMLKEVTEDALHICEVPTKHKKKKKKKCKEVSCNIENNSIKKEKKKKKQIVDVSIESVMLETNNATEKSFSTINEDSDQQQYGNIINEKVNKTKRRKKSKIGNDIITSEDSKKTKKKKTRETSGNEDEVQVSVEAPKKSKKKRKNSVTAETHHDCIALDNESLGPSKYSVISDSNVIVKKAKKSKRN